MFESLPSNAPGFLDVECINQSESIPKVKLRSVADG